MNPEHKKYILENIGKKSSAQIASELGIRERKVRRIVEMEREKGGSQRVIPQEPLPKAPIPPVKKTFILISLALIIILGFAVYANSLHGEFVFDDEHLIKNNIFIKDWANLPKSFTQDIGKGAGKIYPFYRPIQMVTYALDYHIWTLNAAGYHLTSILLHILVALCIYWFINILFEDGVISLLTALFFVVHPIHTTVANNISTRAESLYLLFMLITFISYIKSINIKSSMPYIIMLLSYLLSLLSKENAIILPALVLLYHYAFRERVRLKEFLSILAMIFIYVLVRAIVLRSSISNVVYESTFLQRIPGFFVAIFSYLQLLFLPFDLHVGYGITLFNFDNPRAISGMITLAALIFWIFKTVKTNRLIFFSLSWFIITLFPISNLYPINAFMSENWLYLPSIGFFTALSAFMKILYKNKKILTFTLVLTGCLLAFYSYVTIRQNETWGDPISFYERTLKYVPDDARIYSNLGAEYNRAGRKEEAGAMFKKAIKLSPDYADAYYNLGSVYYEMGRKEEAGIMYKKAIELNPDYAEAYNNLAAIYYEKGEKENAVAMYKKAIELNPNYVDARRNLEAVSKGSK